MQGSAKKRQDSSKSLSKLYNPEVTTEETELADDVIRGLGVLDETFSKQAGSGRVRDP